MSCFLLKTNHGRIFVSFDPGQHITPISPDNQCQPWIYLRPLETTAPLATFFNALHLTRGKVWGGEQNYFTFCGPRFYE
jgi:hypothetical protein